LWIMADDLKQSPDDEYARMGKVQRYIAYGQKGRALRLVEKIIEYDMPLFYGLSDVQEDRRLAWLYRIDLLRDWGRLSEALAWTCLECELNPQNVAAQVLKELLKESLHLQFKSPEDKPIGFTKKSGDRDVREIMTCCRRRFGMPV